MDLETVEERTFVHRESGGGVGLCPNSTSKEAGNRARSRLQRGFIQWQLGDIGTDAPCVNFARTETHFQESLGRLRHRAFFFSRFLRDAQQQPAPHRMRQQKKLELEAGRWKALCCHRVSLPLPRGQGVRAIPGFYGLTGMLRKNRPPFCGFHYQPLR